MTNEIAEVDRLKTEVPALVREAQELQIKNDTDNQRAADMVNALKLRMAAAKKILEPLAAAEKAAKFAHKDMKERIYTPAESACEGLRQRMGDYALAETRRREAVAAEAQRKADKEAEKAQRKADKEAEKAQRKAEKQGIPAPMMPPAPVIVAAPVRVAGMSLVPHYSAEVTDLMALVKAVAAGKAPIDAICANDVWLNATARSRKTEGDMFPGVKCIVRMAPQGTR